MLLEKAWAKVFGSYQRIESGTAGAALPALTGAPSEFLFHEEILSGGSSKKDDIWRKIRDADQKNYIIGTAISSS